MKTRFLYFITSFTICIILGYLSHDLVNGIRIGIGSGIGVVIGMELGKRREKGNNEKQKIILITDELKKVQKL